MEFEAEPFDWLAPASLKPSKASFSVSKPSKPQSANSSFQGLNLDLGDDEFEIVLGNGEKEKGEEGRKKEANSWVEDLEELEVDGRKPAEAGKGGAVGFKGDAVALKAEPSSKPQPVTSATVPTVQSDFESQMLSLLQDTNSLDEDSEENDSFEAPVYEPSSVKQPAKPQSPVVVTTPSFPGPKVEFPVVSAPAEDSEKTTVASTVSSQMGLCLRELTFKVAPPSTPALSSSFRRHRFVDRLSKTGVCSLLSTGPLHITGKLSLPSSPPQEIEPMTVQSIQFDVPKDRIDAGKEENEQIKAVFEPQKMGVTGQKLGIEAHIPIVEVKDPPRPIVPRLELGLLQGNPPPVAAPNPVNPELAKPVPTQAEIPGKKPAPSNPMQLSLHNKLTSQAKKQQEEQPPTPEKQRRLSNEFEEDAMGEAREWQGFSANPELNDSSSEDQDDEFSISATASIKVKAAAEKQYTSAEAEKRDGKPTLESLEFAKNKEKDKKKGKKIDLKTRKMIAEARLQEAPAVTSVIEESKEVIEKSGGKELTQKKPTNPPTFSQGIQKPAAASTVVSQPVLKPINPVLVSPVVIKPASNPLAVPPPPQAKSSLNPASSGPMSASTIPTGVLNDDPIELFLDESDEEFHDIGKIPSPKAANREELDLDEEWNKATVLAVTEMRKPKEELKTALVSFGEIWPIFEAMDIRAYRDPGEEEERKTQAQRVSWVRRCFSSQPEELDESLFDQRRRIFSLLKVSFNESPLHLQILMSVWKHLTSSNDDPPRYGHHWDKLGFQGADPATDLRSMGIFGLLQLLFLASVLKPEALAILAYSRESGCNFPFAAVSLNMTKIMVETIREGKLNKVLNRCREVLMTVSDMQVNVFYAGVFLYWFQTYQKRECTVADIGFLNKEVTTEAKSNPEKLMKVAERAFKSSPPKL